MSPASCRSDQVCWIFFLLAVAQKQGWNVLPCFEAGKKLWKGHCFVFSLTGNSHRGEEGGKQMTD